MKIFYSFSLSLPLSVFAIPLQDFNLASNVLLVLNLGLFDLFDGDDLVRLCAAGGAKDVRERPSKDDG
jgi:hypothetical protein